MFLGYNTNGLAHHDLFDAVELLAEIGYRGVAITIDHNALPPYGKHTGQQIARLRRLLERLGMRSVIETGARFLLDPRAKHEPTLLLRRTAGGGSTSTSTPSTAPPSWAAIACRSGRACLREPASAAAAGHGPAGRRACAKCSTTPRSASVPIGFEPEPGMLIDSMRAFEELLGADRRARTCG